MTVGTRLEVGDRAVVLGLGITGQAIVRALRRRDIAVTAIEDRATDATRSFATTLDVELVEAPDRATLHRTLEGASAFLPSPGVPERHDAFAVSRETGVPLISEFDLARWWDDRPVIAITGTDGKTSVTMLTVAMLEASGVAAVAVGNTETPLIEVIDDPSYDVFVVEASSFRLAHSERFEPTAAAWLNFSPDHLDVHTDLSSYELAKAKIWANLPEDGLAVAPHDDPVVLRHVPDDRAVVIVGLDADGADAYRQDDRLIVSGVEIATVDQLERAFPHDITNTLTAAALALRLGATVHGIHAALATHRLPPHRIQHVATHGGISYYNDSKATVPHAVITAVRSFDSVVLLAGGRNKGLDLGDLGSIADRTRAVVAMGDAADEVAAAFDGAVPVLRAHGMDEALRVAQSVAQIGDAVLLSPGCTSFDAYANYGERGDDFIRAVHELVETS